MAMPSSWRRDEQIALFTLEGVGRAASRMDYAKLTHLNGLWLRGADDARLTGDVLARLEALGINADATAQSRILTLMPGLKERAKTLAGPHRFRRLPGAQRAPALRAQGRGAAHAGSPGDARAPRPGSCRDGFLRRRGRCGAA